MKKFKQLLKRAVSGTLVAATLAAGVPPVLAASTYTFQQRIWTTPFYPIRLPLSRWIKQS